MWYKILGRCRLWLQRGGPENPMRKIRPAQGLVHDDEFGDFHSFETFDKAKWILQSPGVRADAQCDTVHGSKNLLQRAILYRHEKI